MNAHLFQHDLFPMWANENAPFNADLNAFGLTDPDLRFIPQWKLNGAATVSTTGQVSAADDIMVGLLVKKGRALMMVTNYAKQDGEVKVSVDGAKLFGDGHIRNLTFRDADSALKAALSDAASPEELKNRQKTLGDDLLGGGKRPSEEDLTDELEGRNPAAKEAARLVLRSEGNAAMMVVRKHDFRLIEVRPAGP